MQSTSTEIYISNPYTHKNSPITVDVNSNIQEIKVIAEKLFTIPVEKQILCLNEKSLFGLNNNSKINECNIVSGTVVFVKKKSPTPIDRINELELALKEKTQECDKLADKIDEKNEHIFKKNEALSEESLKYSELLSNQESLNEELALKTEECIKLSILLVNKDKKLLTQQNIIAKQEKQYLELLTSLEAKDEEISYQEDIIIKKTNEYEQLTETLQFSVLENILNI